MNKEITKLEFPKYCEATKNSLTFSEETPFEVWEDVGKTLKTIGGAVQLWLGDWLNFGEKRYGEKYSQALDNTNYELQSLQKFSSVAGRTAEIRKKLDAHPTLTLSHWDLIANEKNQEKWVNQATDYNLTVKELREKIKYSKKLPSPELPKGTYNVIYADPAWEYDRTVGQGVAIEQYELMPLQEIKDMQINKIAAEDSILFLWATFPKLKEALEVIEAWGFEYKTVAFTWVKTNKKNDKPFFGIGSYFKSNSEICLLATKGEPHKLVKDNSLSSVIITPLQEHSRKPNEARWRIEKLLGDVPKVELFSREKVKGWENWGNETERF